MKLNLALLKKFIDLPNDEVPQLVELLDDCGLEVKGVLEAGSDVVFQIETLANRGDHLHVLGVARELSARLLTAIHLPAVSSALSDRNPSVVVRNETENCMRYHLLEMTLPEGMQLSKEVSQVLAARLDSDVESLETRADRHVIVDYLNYISLELGHPMHAFDKEKIEGEIIVHMLDAETEVEALDGNTYKVPANSIVIKDRKKIVAVAGVIGCANSMVTPSSTRVLIEAAAFDPVLVRKCARAMGISTDASYAFERGVDPEGIEFALKRLCHLTQGGGGSVQGAAGTDVLGHSLAKGKELSYPTISLDVRKVRAQMNLPRLDQVEITSRLKHYGFALEATQDKFIYQVQVPTWRVWDVESEEDLIEEFVRARGYNTVKLSLPPLDYEPPEDNALDSLMYALEPVLLGNGFTEVMTYSFSPPGDVALLEELKPGSRAEYVQVVNALESKFSHLRTSNVVNLARLAEQNFRRGVNVVKVYEQGILYFLADNEEGYVERDTITLVAGGRWYENEWKKAPGLEQVMRHVQGVLVSLFGALGNTLEFIPSKSEYLHPGKQAACKVGRTTCGVCGVIHPKILEAVDCREQLVYVELDCASLQKCRTERRYRAPSDFPSIQRDVTLVVKADEFASHISKKIEALKPADLHWVKVVDDFQRDGEDIRRTTFRLEFQSQSRTLEHSEVDRSMASILDALKGKHSIVLAE